MSVLVIVPCGHSKIWDRNKRAGATAARFAYTGVPFRVNCEFAQKYGSEWLILSAKYGFISPGFLIPGPYNVSFNDRRTNPVPYDMLKEQAVSRRLFQFQTVIGLGGKEYVNAIRAAFAGFAGEIIFPFAGLPIGKMLQATRVAIDSGVYSVT